MLSVHDDHRIGSVQARVIHIPSVIVEKNVMLLILGCFTICWLPYFVVTLYARATGNTSPTLYEVFFNLAVANSCMNPLIYAWKNKNFRKAFLCIVKCHKPTSLSSTNFVTNHVPSKKNSINGICNMACQQEEIVQCELNMEMHTTTISQISNTTNCNNTIYIISFTVAIHFLSFTMCPVQSVVLGEEIYYTPYRNTCKF
ncbi:hypothetical protein NQ318_017344 [Aromia moschata]|uniref:G-protein coupled receptors family 1 profile domain-containing protein n=1 Tax=Aromia moschata TaxID=1265417 RepID=A0AAV8XB10_9CUCU|nr:hypothetical protein NQ318_017344 [Aromia moschata]